MSGFRFKLQKVLDLRQRLEKESATRLVTAREEAAQAQAALEALRQAWRQGVEEAGRTAETPVSAGELQQLSMLISQLEAHLEAAQTASQEADAHVHEMLVEFERAFKDRQVMDKLRERQHATWAENVNRQDQMAIDAVALSQHTRKPREGET